MGHDAEEECRELLGLRRPRLRVRGADVLRREALEVAPVAELAVVVVGAALCGRAEGATAGEGTRRYRDARTRDARTGSANRIVTHRTGSQGRARLQVTQAGIRSSSGSRAAVGGRVRVVDAPPSSAPV